VDTPEGSDDVSLRPNQLLALSLPYPLLAPEQARAVLKTVGQHLLTSYGLRSLAPSDPRYHGAYGGSQRERDGAYHQGTAWTWLLGPYAEAYARVTGDRSTARSLLQPLAHHLCDAGLGTVSEILDGDPPHTPRGCIAGLGRGGGPARLAGAHLSATLTGQGPAASAGPCPRLTPTW